MIFNDLVKITKQNFFCDQKSLTVCFLSKFVNSINQINKLWTMYLSISMAFLKA